MKSRKPKSRRSSADALTDDKTPCHAAENGGCVSVTSVGDLKPAPYNPRRIDAKSAAGLARSFTEFGDISGLVWNRRTGHLVAGHQRLDALKRDHGDKLHMDQGAVVTPAGERFPVRVVDWPVEKEKAANVAANSPLLAGSFTPEGLEAVLADLKAADGLDGLFDGLRLDELLPALGDLVPVPGGAPEADAGLPGTNEADASGEWITFSTPLTHAQHHVVMDAIRRAKSSGGEKLADCLAMIASSYLTEVTQ